MHAALINLLHSKALALHSVILVRSLQVFGYTPSVHELNGSPLQTSALRKNTVADCRPNLGLDRLLGLYL
jgi:hypothetical protein